MTPLAQAIANDACLPLAKRRFGNLAREIGLFDDLHFFECSAIYEAAVGIADKLAVDRTSKARKMTFLAAPRMLIEIATPSCVTNRQAFLLEQDGDCARVTSLFMARADGFVARNPASITIPMMKSDEPLGTYTMDRGHPITDDPEYRPAMDALASGIVALLAMINTPRVIGRRQQMPHAGLQRKLVASRAMVGKFPLRAWTELKLEVSPPRDASSDGDHETHLTGGKALHFCRCHLRIRLGQLELVSAHWRGDPALGIKRIRYAVVPPKDGVWPRWAA